MGLSGGRAVLSTTVVVILGHGTVLARPRSAPISPFSATERTAHRRFATAEISTVRCATHSRFASHRQSPPTPICDHMQRGGRCVVSAGAKVPTGATPRQAALAAAAFLHAGALVAPAPAASGSDNSGPRLDATGATATSAGCSWRSALQPSPAARTAGGFRPR